MSGAVRRRCLRHGTLSVGRCPACQDERARRRSPGYAERVALHSDALARRLRRAVLERDGYVCRWCGGEADTIDYVVALGAGGERTPENAVAACRRCNSRRGGAVGAARLRQRRLEAERATGDVLA